MIQKTVEFNSTRAYEAWRELNEGFVIIQNIAYANITFAYPLIIGYNSPIPAMTVTYLEFPRDS